MWIPIEQAIRALPMTTVVVAHMPEITTKVREIRGLSIAGAAKEIGISNETLARYERRSQMGATHETFISILAWVSTFSTTDGRVRFEMQQIAREAEEASRG